MLSLKYNRSYNPRLPGAFSYLTSFASITGSYKVVPLIIVQNTNILQTVPLSFFLIQVL